MAASTVRIGGASGAWGDSPRAIPQLLGEPLDYLMMDYLAEVSMSLLARARMKAPDGGFPPDFNLYLKDFLPQLARRKIKVVANAGGVNPRGCKAALQALCKEWGVDLCIAAVTGDDVIPLTDDIRLAEVRATAAPPVDRECLFRRVADQGGVGSRSRYRDNRSVRG